MSEHRGEHGKLSAGCRKLLAGVVVIVAVSACGKRLDGPDVPSAPRPTTGANGHLFTAQLDLPARPVQAPPGEM